MSICYGQKTLTLLTRVSVVEGDLRKKRKDYFDEIYVDTTDKSKQTNRLRVIALPHREGEDCRMELLLGELNH